MCLSKLIVSEGMHWSRGQGVSECEKPWDLSKSRTVRERWRQAGAGMSRAAGRACCTARLTSELARRWANLDKLGPEKGRCPRPPHSPSLLRRSKLQSLPGSLGGTPNCEAGPPSSCGE